MQAVIYKIENVVNGDCYIGSTVRLSKRTNTHWKSLQDGTHHSVVFQRAYNKYGKDVFNMVILEQFSFIDKEHLLAKEQFYIDKLSPKYNICKIAGSQLGTKRDDNFRQKCRDRMKGRKAWNKGLKTGAQSDFTKNKRSKSMLGKVCKDETRVKIKEQVSKPVFQYTPEGVFIRQWSSAKEVSKVFGCSYANLVTYLTGNSQTKIDTFKGFIWCR